jgi:aryl-alcohol dehydrogenase-like predicted oxidoreductase
MMDLTSYRSVGRSGLIVSPLALGTMTFATPRWGASDADARHLFDHYLDQGGNFIDTADICAGGQSEALLGRFIADSRVRDRVVLATKFGFNGAASPLETTSAGRGNPNAGGAGAKNIHRALDGSLARLGTDYIDLYWMHIWDGVTPVEEIVQTLGDLVRAGKIRYYGFSDMPAWLAIKAATIASERRIPGPIAMQVEYSLVARDIEREHVPVAREAGMAVMPWSPLAGGFLSGKYLQGEQHAGGRLSGANPFGDSKFSDKNWAILSVVREVSKEVERSPAQVALAWALGRPMVGSVLIGASRCDQLDDNLAALSCNLSAEQRARLDVASAIAPGFTDSLTSAFIRHMVFGGHDVQGWGEASA